MMRVRIRREPEPGSWATRRAYTNPSEYKYYTYQLLRTRLREYALRKCVAKWERG